MGKGLSATQRTLRLLRQQGRVCAIAEKWNPHVGPHGIRQDLFGWIDIVALDPERGIIGVQSCGQSFSEHLRKICDSECTENVIEWLRCSGKVELWGWRKLLVKRGGKARVWVPRAREITLEDFPNIDARTVKV
jgi:hypothetical protein